MNIPSILNTSAYRAVTSVQGCADWQLTVVENKLLQGFKSIAGMKETLSSLILFFSPAALFS